MYSIALHPERRIAIFNFQGEVTLYEGSAAFLDYVHRPEFQPDAIMVTDARGVTATSGAFLEILRAVHGLGAAFRRFRKAAKSVILVDNDVQLGAATVLAQVLDLVGPVQVIIVRSEGDLFSQSGLTFSELAALNPAASALVHS